jgi:hypothetical protein
MKQLIGIMMGLSILLGSFNVVYALDAASAMQAYAAELIALGMTEPTANQKANADVTALVANMQAAQSNVEFAYDGLAERVDSLPKNDLRKDSADDALDAAESAKDVFVDMDPSQNIFVQESIGGAPPRVLAGEAFQLAQEDAEATQSFVNRILIAPTQPGAVPTGDIVSDFIPQIIRQLFRFAWVAVLIAFTVSGVLFIIAHGNDERLTKAKTMLYFTLMGFAVVALSFAIVKAVTDIDFFRFI